MNYTNNFRSRSGGKIFLLGFLLMFGMACGSLSSSSSFDFSGLADISALQTTLSDTFFLDADGMAKVSRASPFLGSDATCSHLGAHVNFTNDGAPYTVNLYAPAAGIITRVDTCVDIGESDRYGFDLAIANSGSHTVIFHYSIEPQDGHLCSTGSPTYFAPYILVTEGQSVTKGELLGQFLKTDTGDDAAHVHYNLAYDGEDNSEMCPNIFEGTIVTQLVGLFTTDTCNGALTDSLCFKPADDEIIIQE